MDGESILWYFIELYLKIIKTHNKLDNVLQVGSKYPSSSLPLGD